MTKEPLIKLKNVSKHYVKNKMSIDIFDELDLAIKENEFVAVMGPSGSGKTTLLNLIGGIDRPTSGTITFGGEQIDTFSESQLSKWRAVNVGFIFQFYNLMPMLTATQNVELPLLLTRLSKSKRAEHVKTALSIVELEDRAKFYPREMSGGQQQRVAIARAIVSDPKVLLCDEPTGDLDRETAEEILKILQLLAKDFGKTVILVTHDPEAAKFAGRKLYLDKGKFFERKAA